MSDGDVRKTWENPTGQHRKGDPLRKSAIASAKFLAMAVIWLFLGVGCVCGCAEMGNGGGCSGMLSNFK